MERSTVACELADIRMQMEVVICGLLRNSELEGLEDPESKDEAACLLYGSVSILESLKARLDTIRDSGAADNIEISRG